MREIGMKKMTQTTMLKMDTNKMCLHTVIIGGGPAGCNLLTNFALNGEYDDLLDRGIAIVESSPCLGGGSLNQYRQLMSNSHGCAFYDAIETLGIETHDRTLNRPSIIPMSDLYLLQKTIGSYHEKKISSHPISKALTNTTVVDVKEHDDGTYYIRCKKNSATEDEKCILSELWTCNICICTGAKQRIPSWIIERCIAFDAANDYFEGTRSPNLQAKDIAIIGFSHSAFSMGHLWHKHSPKANITYILRHERSLNQPSIFFPSTEEANTAKYPFTKTDVCPETNRIHRFGGLRGNAREFALQTESYTTMAVTNFKPVNYDHVIVACGYESQLLSIIDKKGTRLEPKFDHGGAVVDSQGKLFADHYIYAFGIGAGLHPSEETGGEPGCTRRSDGIWLYQYTIGSIIRTALCSHGWKSSQAKFIDTYSQDNERKVSTTSNVMSFPTGLL